MVVITGALVGGIAGYYSGYTDDFLSLLINVFLLLPGLPLMVVLAAFLPPGFLITTLALPFSERMLVCWARLIVDSFTAFVLVMGLMNDGTALYKVIENVSVSETHELDFSNFLQAEQRIINNLTGIDCSWLGHSGFSIEDSHLGENGYRLSNGSGEGIAWTAGQNFIANYPPSFTKFTTGITVGQYNIPGEKSWYQKTFGEMPESVRLIDGDINVINSDIDNSIERILPPCSCHTRPLIIVPLLGKCDFHLPCPI